MNHLPSFDEFHTECPQCGNIQNKSNTWFECCGSTVHEQCSNCGTMFFWSGKIHECEPEPKMSIMAMAIWFNKVYRRPVFRRAIAVKGLIDEGF